MKRLSIILLIEFIFKLSFAQQATVCYVSPKGSDLNPGTINKPFGTVDKARDYILEQRIIKPGAFKVILRGGVYALKKPLLFGPLLSGDTTSTIEFTSYPGERATLSGGKTLSGTWVKTANTNIWKLNLHSNFKTIPNIHAFFKNDVRLPRASSDTLITKGPLPQFSHLYKMYDFKVLDRLVKDSLNVFSGFNYDGNDLDNIKDITNAEVLVINSWEGSWHNIYKIDKENKLIYFKNPAMYPVGFYNPRVRYVIQNSLDYLNKPGQWCFDNTSGNMFYYAQPGENPNQAQFTIPVLDTIISGKGDGRSNRLVSNIKFSDINFSYSNSAWGVYLILSITGNKVLHNAYMAENKKRYPYMDFNKGFASGQAALDCGSAITLEACRNWSFTNCSFTHLGNYAVGIIQYSSNNTLSNCTINDAGGGGIMIAFNSPGGKLRNLPDRVSPTGNKVLNCTISNCGAFFISGIGIAVMQANHTLINHNLIYNMPYSGISVGWTYNSTMDNYTSYNTISNNHIHDVMKILNDGGGIYTLGKQIGSVYKGNYIYNIHRSNHSIGAPNDGFFFDVGSSELKVDSNVVYNVANADKRFNLSDSTQIKFGTNYWEKTTPANRPLKDMLFRKVLK